MEYHPTMLPLLGIAGLLLLQQAQTAAPAPADDPVTLRIYENLVQIPVLVLSDKRQRVAPLSPDQFIMNIDGGPYFQPRRIRQEGTDAIRLVILMDVTPNTEKLLSQIGPAIQELSPSLTDKDTVSLSVLRDNVLSHTQPASFTDEWRKKLANFGQEQVALPVTDAPTAPTAPLRLWNAVSFTLGRFATSANRRVLLLITDGKDRGSTISIPDLRHLATERGVTIFALRTRPEAETRKDNNVLSRDAFGFAKPSTEGEDPLATLTELTGGTTLEMRGHPLAEGLLRVVRLARERYILDFTMPSKLGLGIHVMDIRTRQRNLFVRAGGTSAPMPDPAIANDPNTLQSDHSTEPPIGTRRILRR